MFLCFVGVGSNVLASKTIYCRALRDYRDNTMYDRKWATAEGGGLGGHDGDCLLFPQLSPMRYTSNSPNYGFRYWPSRYSSESLSPIVYTVQAMTATSITVDNQHTNQIDNIINTLNSTFSTSAQRAAVNSISLSYLSDGTPVINTTTYDYGYKVAGKGVATSDSNGNPIIAYSDSTGYASGYEPIGSDGSFVPVFYDLNHISNGYALRLNSLENVSSSSLTFDSITGQYSFDYPDYSPQLNLIQSDLHTLANKEFVVDNIRLELPSDFEVNIPPPQVTVNPEITVNPPSVTVTPEVTVNVTSPNQNDITVAIDNSDVVNSIKDLNSDLLESTIDFTDLYQSSYSVDDFNTTVGQLTQEEQGIIDIVNGWNTQIPVISNACNVAFNAAFGSVPSIPPSNLVPISGINLFGFDVTIDLRPYQSMFVWFRAFVLMLEVVWFIDSMWRTCVNALKV